jgi:hydroxymethylpyrimidine/phosphomethylpyrimidine kinase
MSHTPTILTIAGSDPFGGAGIQVDCKTIHALGGYALSAITALTSQNATGVKAVHLTPAEVLRSQITTLLDEISVDAIKIGMLGSAESVAVVTEILQDHPTIPVVLDPVLLSSSGSILLSAEGIAVMKKRLFPLATLITPNIPECLHFAGSDCTELEKLTEKLHTHALLLKGGHSNDPAASTDTLISPEGIWRFSTPRIETSHTHGTGCILSSAIATYLAQKETLPESVEKAKEFLSRHLEQSKISFQYRKKESERKEPII